MENNQYSTFIKLKYLMSLCSCEILVFALLCPNSADQAGCAGRADLAAFANGFNLDKLKNAQGGCNRTLANTVLRHISSSWVKIGWHTEIHLPGTT